MAKWLGVCLEIRRPGFKTRSDHSLNLFLVVHGSTSQLHLQKGNWFTSGQLLLLFCTVVSLCFVGPEKPLWVN